MPIDIKVRRKSRSGTVLQQVHPPGILACGRHVIGNNVEQQTHAMLLQLPDQIVEFFVRPQVCIEVSWIRYIVAVHASVFCLQKG